MKNYEKFKAMNVDEMAKFTTKYMMKWESEVEE